MFPERGSIVEEVGSYIVSVSATALICGIVKSITKDTAAAKILKLVCNLILLLTVLRPMGSIENLGIADFSLPGIPDASKLIAEGERASRNAVADIIIRKTEAYIVDKAAAMGAAVSVSVTVSGDEPPIPVCVEISGSVSPYLKLRLEEMIQEDLNISKENQLWTG